jgi:hypothetical protein
LALCRPQLGNAEESLQFADHGSRVIEDVHGGVPPELISPCSRLPLSEPILVPGMVRVVEAIAVQLDGEPILRPPAVDPMAAGHSIRDREWEASLFEPPQKRSLQSAESDPDFTVKYTLERRSPGSAQ